MPTEADRALLAALEPFLAGTEPTDVATGVKEPVNFGLDDYER